MNAVISSVHNIARLLILQFHHKSGYRCCECVGSCDLSASPTVWGGWSSNAYDLWSGGANFEYRPLHRLSWRRMFHGDFQSVPHLRRKVQACAVRIYCHYSILHWLSSHEITKIFEVRSCCLQTTFSPCWRFWNGGRNIHFVTNITTLG